MQLYFPCSPREVDFLRLLEAVEQEEKLGPVKLSDAPSVQLLQSLLLHLQEWRTAAQSTITASRSLLAPTHILSAKVSGVKTEAPVNNISALEDVQQKLGDLALEMQQQFPGWCKHMDELQTIILVSLS